MLTSPLSPEPSTDFYKHHVFFCLNQRESGGQHCASGNAQAMFDYTKHRVKAVGLAGAGQVRINKAGCLNRCEEGPVLVIYPEGTWYTYIDETDIDDIVDTHLVRGEVVKRLKLAT